jgi:hypothetical protein
VVAGDDTAGLEFADALVHGGRRQADLPPELGVGRPAVLSECGDDAAVDGVHGGTLAGAERSLRSEHRYEHRVRSRRFVPYYLFTIRQPFEYPMVEMQRLVCPGQTY